MSTIFHDDGNWNWKYECIYVNPTQDPKDWVYEIVFETKEGGYLSGEEITCFYYKTENVLSVSRNRGKIRFHVENFDDIEKILLPMVKAHDAVPYPIYVSKIGRTRKERRQKLKNINKLFYPEN